MKIVKVCKGLSVKRGLDGHWLNFESGGKYASINIENVFGGKNKGNIVYSALMNWVTQQLDQPAPEADYEI